MSVTNFLSLPNRSHSSRPVYSPFILSRREPLSSYQISFPKYQSPFSPEYRERDHYFIKEIAPSNILNEQIDAALASGIGIADSSVLKNNNSTDPHSTPFESARGRSSQLIPAIGGNKRGSTSSQGGFGGKKKRSTNKQQQSSNRGGRSQGKRRTGGTLLD